LGNCSAHNAGNTRLESRYARVGTEKEAGVDQQLVGGTATIREGAARMSVIGT
jgi:hypothetical protein